MKEIFAQDQNEWIKCASTWLNEKKQSSAAQSLYIPAGETPKLIYRDWQNTRPEFLKKMKLIQIDDVMTGAKTNIFKQFFNEHLPAYSENIEYIDEANTQAELGILGLGLNGHVAFHEPGLPFNFYSGCVQLQNETLTNLSLEKGTWGKTYGLGAFMKCRSLLLIVKGTGKKSILKRTLLRDSALPSSQLLNHRDLTILRDFEL